MMLCCDFLPVWCRAIPGTRRLPAEAMAPFGDLLPGESEGEREKVWGQFLTSS
jgi:hypothetical protein